MISPSNPGNIRFNPDLSGIVGQINGFAVFENVGYGYKAIYSILSTYLNKYGLNTISKIAARYAPGSENNTARWASIVSTTTGIPLNSPITEDDFYRLISGIVRIENGIVISPSDVQKNISSAGKIFFLSFPIIAAIFGLLYIFRNGKAKI